MMTHVQRLATLVLVGAALGSAPLFGPPIHAQQPRPVTPTDSAYYVRTYLYPARQPAIPLRMVLPTFISLQEGPAPAPWTDAWFVQTYLTHPTKSIALPTTRQSE